MNHKDIRDDAWDKAIHAEGTRAIFQRRANKLWWKTHARDWVGIAVPILLAYWASSDLYEPLKSYKPFATGLLGILAPLQALLVAWSLISKWDEKYAYCVNGAGDSYRFREGWKKLGNGTLRTRASSMICFLEIRIFGMPKMLSRASHNES